MMFSASVPRVPKFIEFEEYGRPFSDVQGPNNSQFPGPNPFPLALVIDMHASETLCTGLYKSRVHK
jgi:hypothetical protein